MGALDWIGDLVRWVAQWIPRWVTIPVTEAAIKHEGFFLPSWLRSFKDDIRITALGPGLHWYWPATSQLEKYPIAYQMDHLPSQTFETEDGHSITVGGIVSYRITDVKALLANTHSAVHTIRIAALSAIHDVISRMTLAQLKLEQRKGTLKTKLRNAVQKPLTEFGVKIEECMLTDLTRSRAYRLINSTQKNDDE